MTKLEDLGDRICILGPSNSGKSTLAEAISSKRNLPSIHLDQLHHLPFTNWEMRAPEEFSLLHDEAITREKWVMDGNYSRLFPQRFARATGVILLDISTGLSLYRYVRRTLFEKKRPGNLQGAPDTLKYALLHHIAIVTPANRRRYRDVYEQLELPKMCVPSAKAMRVLYQAWGLRRRG